MVNLQSVDQSTCPFMLAMCVHLTIEREKMLIPPRYFVPVVRRAQLEKYLESYSHTGGLENPQEIALLQAW